MGDAIIKCIKAVWQILHSPDNDVIVVALLIAFVPLFISQVRGFLSYRKILKEKDTRIEDLVEQRNLFQDIALNKLGIKRISSLRGKASRRSNKN